MSEERDLLDELAFVMHSQGYCGEVCVCTDDARALLPVVEAIAAERAAAELRALREDVTAIADEMEDDESIGIPPNVPMLIDALRRVATLDPK